MAGPAGDNIRVREESRDQAGSEQPSFESMTIITRPPEQRHDLAMFVQEELGPSMYEQRVNEFVTSNPQVDSTGYGSMHQTVNGRWIKLSEVVLMPLSTALLTSYSSRSSKKGNSSGRRGKLKCPKCRKSKRVSPQ
jgi:hypothetical protein